MIPSQYHRRKENIMIWYIIIGLIVAWIAFTTIRDIKPTWFCSRINRKVYNKIKDMVESGAYISNNRVSTNIIYKNVSVEIFLHYDPILIKFNDESSHCFGQNKFTLPEYFWSSLYDLLMDKGMCYLPVLDTSSAIQENQENDYERNKRLFLEI